jgi:tetratricopeptide (TPR) repeat protein
MNRATDQRTDEFSFCVALYDAVYGAPPFAGNSVGELLYNVVQGQIQPPPANRRVPAWLRKALLRGLSTEPGARYPNMVSLLADLSLDRRRARQRWLGALAGALALASLIGLAVFWQRARTRLAERRCSQAGAALDRVWGKARQQAAHDALKRSGASFAEDTWQRIMRNVDRYLEGWQTVRDRQCHASYSEHQLKPILLQRSLRCLDQKLASVGAFAQVLSKADESAITQAAEVSGSFPELDECEDRLLLALLAPEKPEQQAPLDDFNQKLEEARLLGELGRYVEQRELAKKTLAMARRIGYPPAIADALALLALSESSNGDYASADRDYFAAAVTSIEGGDHQQTVEHFLSLMSLLGTKLAQKDQALRYEQLAAAELRTVVSSERIKLALQRRMALIACQVHFTAEPRRLDLAESECKHALALQAKLYPAGHRMDFSILNNLAIVYKRQDRFAEALGLYQQVLGYYEKSRGPQHPSVATEIYNIGRIFEAEDKFAEAKQYYDRSLQLRSRGLGPEHPQLLATIGSLVDVALRQADYPAALSYAERYRKIKLREAGKDDNAKMAPAHGLLGRVLYKQGRFDDALKEHQRAVELCQRHRCEYASYMVAEADDWRALGKNKQAVPLLEQALKLEQGASVAPLYLARNQFSLAQALWATDKKRSRARILMLLDSAQELYQKAGRTSHFELEEITAWRAKNPVAAANPPKRSLSRDR